MAHRASGKEVPDPANRIRARGGHGGEWRLDDVRSASRQRNPVEPRHLPPPGPSAVTDSSHVQNQKLGE